MATFNGSRRLLISAGAGALGGAALLTVLGGTIATTADTSSVVGADFPVCHTPSASGMPKMMFRLAQTEVPRAEMSAARSAPAFADTEPPLWAGLGSVTYRITTSNDRAQAYFDQGLRLAYAFNHGEAQRAFRMAQKLDPDCAMCFWGEALVLGPNINLPMQEDAMGPAYAAAQKAKALAGKASPLERLREIATLHLGRLGRDRDLAIVFQIELRQSTKFMERFSATHLREYLGLIRDVIAEGQAKGMFRKQINPTVAAKVFFGALDEMATNWVLSKRRYSLVAEADAVVDLFVGGVGSSPAHRLPHED